MEIKVLGTGCPKCQRLEELARQAVDELGVEATIAHIRDMNDILSYDVVSTPGLVIEGEVKSAGRLPRKEEIFEWIRAAEAL
jgi:small redox-active disulfide protein 2